MKRTTASVLTFWLTAILASTAQATSLSYTRVVAVTGQDAPDGNGHFDGFRNPTVNDAGKAAFSSVLRSSSSGIFIGDGVTGLAPIAREGDSISSGDGNVLSFRGGFADLVVLNDAGQVAFRAYFGGTSGGNRDNHGIFLSDGLTGLVQIAREGQVAPDGNGVFLHVLEPRLNNLGEAAFLAFSTGTDGGASDDSGIYLGNSVTGLVQIAREGQVVPDGNGRFSGGFQLPAINEVGQVAFRATVRDISGSSNEDSIFIGDATTSLLQIARENQALSDGNGRFASLGFPSLNDAGQVAFRADLRGTSGGNRDNGGIFLGNGLTSLLQIAREGEVAPDGNGVFSNFLTPTLNDGGQVLFGAQLDGTSNDSGIFLMDKVTGLVQVAREGDVAPDGNGRFSALLSGALNNAGQVAFRARLQTTSGRPNDDFGLFFYDDSLGLLQIARYGDNLMGSTITELYTNSTGGSFGDETSSLNNHGQIAYRFRLADGRDGIAIWTPIPEPKSVVMLVFAIPLVVWRVRCRRDSTVITLIH